MRSIKQQLTKNDLTDTISGRASEIMRRVRKSQQLKQSLVSANLGITQSALSRIEKGKRVPTLTEWIRFCELTGTETTTLLTDKVETSYTTKAIPHNQKK